ncbi:MULTISPECIES: hypothetical protein [unclassified Burkholderia]|uniref:hypothetical protein n=1 Tax=unclassified Burkholderia TaxID=2613784 RepID=UPI000F55AA3A|nr:MULTISPECIES: hypothetical protein [unclassified Burkholderia]RQS29425.1 hypothetical protein DIE05_13555 [Burkholderia sp. Bp8995]RQS47671.1 hypothetical protein DIE00_14135 [Burkholderia sp. Bp8989]
MKRNELNRPGIPLFFKLWFAFVAFLAICIIGGYIVAAVKIFGVLQGASPETVGAAVGKAVAAYQKAQQ